MAPRSVTYVGSLSCLSAYDQLMVLLVILMIQTVIYLGARRAAAMGYEGKWAIHPSQIELANQVYTPSEAEVDKAHRILAALEEAAAQGKGAASLDGRMIDEASAKMAENVVNTDTAIKAKS